MKNGVVASRRAWAASRTAAVRPQPNNAASSVAAAVGRLRAGHSLLVQREGVMRSGLCFLRAPFSSGRAGTPISSSAAPAEEEEVLPGAFKSPITKALWEIRRAEMKFQERRRAPGGEAPLEDLRPVPPSLSRSAIHYPFSTDSFLREDYRNPSGHVRIGRILEDLDALAGNISFKHCSEDPSFPLLVTASVDRIVLRRHPRLDCDMTLMGRVVWTGRSSMVINVRCSSSPPGVCYVGGDLWADDESCWLDANFTFVARDRETGRSRAISPLDLGGDSFQEEEGNASDIHPAEKDADDGWKALRRQVQRHKDRQALERKAAKEGAAFEGFLELEAARLKRDEEATKLVSAGFPLLHLPALADPHAVLVRQTAVSSTLICMPQHRNTANRIFGGFLMHRAYEVAFCAAFMFGGSRPRFSEIDEVVFLQPVDVGDLVHLEACVLYTKQGKDGDSSPQACVEVLASVVRPEAVESKVSNRFNLTFSFPELAGGKQGRPEGSPAVLRSVLPADATEGSRIVTAMTRDRLQDAADDMAHIDR